MINLQEWYVLIITWCLFSRLYALKCNMGMKKLVEEWYSGTIVGYQKRLRKNWAKIVHKPHWILTLFIWGCVRSKKSQMPDQALSSNNKLNYIIENPSHKSSLKTIFKLAVHLRDERSFLEPRLVVFVFGTFRPFSQFFVLFLNFFSI